MQTKILAGMLGAAAAAATLTTLVLQPGTSTDVDGTVVGPVAQVAGAPAARSDGAVKQGITIEGHWTIEVQNPDGTVAQRSEFKNAFLGHEQLVVMLGGDRPTIHTWLLELEGTGLACAPSASCLLVQTQRSGFAASTEGQLGVTYITGPSYGIEGLRLAGRIAASANGQIEFVRTKNYLCEDTAPYTQCAATNSATRGINVQPRFTEHFMSGGPIPVVGGQSILVSVDIMVN